MKPIKHLFFLLIIISLALNSCFLSENKENETGIYEYNFKIESNNNIFTLTVDVKGEQPLTFSRKMIPIKEAENYILNRSIKKKNFQLESLEKLFNSDETIYFNRYGIGLNSLEFEKKTCTFYFVDQCAYTFDCSYENNQLNLLWNYEIDCTINHNIDSILRKQPSLLKNQIIGNFVLDSDSTLIFKNHGIDYLGKILKEVYDEGTLHPYLFTLEK